MSKVAERIEPGEVDLEVLERLNVALQEASGPMFVGREGTSVPLPDPLFHLLLHVVQGMRKGRAMILVREDEMFTTQAAANYLGVSRPFLVKLLEEGQIPFHKVGTHRKVSYKDLMDYGKAQSAKRRKFVSDLGDAVRDADLYE